MNAKTKAARKYKSKMWIRYRESKEYNDFIEYKRAQNKAVKEYRKAKRNFERNLAKNIKNNPKSFYAYVRSKSKVKEVVGPLLDKKGEWVYDTNKKCDILNRFFASVFTEEKDTDKMPEVKQKFNKDSDHMLKDIDITRDLVLTKLKRLKVNKAPGVDNIATRILIENAEVLSEPLCYIFLDSLKNGIVPNNWKTANVSAIFKKGKKEMPCNYRPVSLTSHICKVMESIIKDKMIDHLNKFDLINLTQHGFLSRRSCLTNLLDFLETVTNYVDCGYPVDVIYLDFQKAFDKVPHKRLMLKIQSLGIVAKVHDWIKDWLIDRKQRVVLTGNSSEWINVISGVPHGSVLGPLLFLIYINDIDNTVCSNILKFADDTKSFRAVKTDEDVSKLQEDLNNLYDWFIEWLMLFNIEKCKVMHIGFNNRLYNYKMSDTILEEVKEERDLGVIVQDNLKWNKQCIKATHKANRVIGMIRRTFSDLNAEIVLPLYKSLVRPHLEYCIQAWRPYLKKDIDL